MKHITFCQIEHKGYKMSTSVLRVILIIVLLSIFELGLAVAIFLMPDSAISTTELVHSQLSETGFIRPITALLLDYRSIDTLFTLAILFIAIQSVWHCDHTPSQKTDHHDFSILSSHWVLILIVLTIALLFWKERYILAATLIAGCGVLLRLKLMRQGPSTTSTFSLRLGLSSGLLVFLTTALVTMVSGYHWLEYPEKWTNELILLLSVCLTISIGLSLTIFFFRASGFSWRK
jgi:multisubunit Na+/H+ antiporter MnhB subunit